MRALRRERYARRSVSSRWLVDRAKAEAGPQFVEFAPAPATCGWAADSVVGVHRSSGGVARFSGVQTCSSVWSCPCCGALIRSRRAQEVQDAAAWWEGQGKSFLFLTFTVRHFLEDPLTATSDAVTAAFTQMINGAPWKRFARRHGIRHFIKSQEVTLGWENGWHAHLHVLFFVDLDGAAADLVADAQAAVAECEDWAAEHGGRVHVSKARKALRRLEDADEAARIARLGISEARHDEMKEWLFPRWREKVLDAGGREPDWEHGLKVQTVRGGNVVALYMAKLQEGDRPRQQWSIGKEMSRNDIKKGRLDSLVPFELLDLDGLSPEAIERNREYWLEYVAATAGRRAMTWSRGLKELAGIDEAEDEELIADEAADVEPDELVVLIKARDWARIKYDPAVVCRVLELVEAGREDELGPLVAFEYPPPGYRAAA